MSTPATIAPPVENPWKKRRKGPQEFMPPSRALFAEKNGARATATWCYRGNHWKCESTGGSGLLCWMRGMVISGQPQADAIKDKLYRDGFQPGIHWHWIQPNTVRVMEPPF